MIWKKNRTLILLESLLAMATVGCKERHVKNWYEDKAKGIVVVTVSWQCDQTRETQVPALQDITVILPVDKLKQSIAKGLDIKDESLQVTSADFDRILELSRKSPFPSMDFSQCASNFMADMREMAVDVCANLKPDSMPRTVLTNARDVQALIDNCELYTGFLLRKMIDTEAAFYQSGGSVPPFLPGGNTQPPLSSDTIDEMKSILTSSCGDSLTGDFRYLDGQFLDTLAGIAPTLDQGCKDKVFGLYLDLLDQSKPLNCNVAQDLCKEQSKAILTTLGKLKDSGFKPISVDYTPLSENTCTSIGYSGTTGVDEALRSIYDDLRDLLTCSNPKPGEEIVYGGNHSSPVPSRYVLTKAPGSPPAYTATINPQFENPNDLVKARSCLSKANPKLIGPKGELLTIAIYQDRPTRTPPPISTIKSQAAGARSNSGAWASDADCTRVTHEILHLLGLVDEYQELATGYVLNDGGDWVPVEKGATLLSDNCRSVEFTGPINTMSNSWASFNATRQYVNSTFCYCPSALIDPTSVPPLSNPASTSCENELNTLLNGTDTTCPVSAYLQLLSRNDESTPENTVALHSFKDPIAIWNATDGSQNHRIVAPGILSLKSQVIPAQRNTLLNAEQFYFIIDPDCAMRNKRYHFCARESYSTYYDQLNARSLGPQCNPRTPRVCRYPVSFGGYGNPF